MITVKVPATSANCCIGFDCLGLALDWKSAISFEAASTLQITGCPEEYQSEDNLVFQAFAAACTSCGITAGGVHIHIDSDIPFARGLGSSSQCIAAGILGADALLGLNLDDQKMLEIATALEGHPDNAAPALFGGLCACVSEDDQILQIKLGSNDWKGLVVIPPYPISTNEARKVLPPEISLHEAAMQSGRAFLFEYAWEHRNEKLLHEACKDVLHEPYRARLIPDYARLKELAERYALPFWISGSGSTMIFVSQSEEKLKEAEKEICRMNIEADIRRVRVSDKGAEVLYG